jgi:hypothetical protein
MNTMGIWEMILINDGSKDQLLQKSAPTQKQTQKIKVANIPIQ